MGIKLSQIADGKIEVISRLDDSLVFDQVAYEKYLQTLDESLLTFVADPKPTRFILRKVLPYKMAQKVQNKQVKFEKGEAQFQMSFMAEEVRCSLIDIKNHENMPQDQKICFERGDDGGASDDLIAKLMAVGIAQDLYIAKKNVTEQKQDGGLKKSS
jgi:hypothetical protein